MDESFGSSGGAVEKRKFWKFLLIMFTVVVGLTIVIARLFYVQILKGDHYKEIARKMHRSKVTLAAERGDIFDRNYIPLASTIEKYSVAADPLMFKSDNPEIQAEHERTKKRICALLSRATGVKSNKYINEINSAPGAFVWLERGLEYDDVKTLKKIDHRGLILITEPRRNFFYGYVGAQIVGYTNIDNVGVSGVERDWNSVLSGKSGFIVMRRDGVGRLHPSADLPVTPALHGNSLVLNIDIELQRILEFELKRGAEHMGAKTASAVAIEPQTGKILAMASYPEFNPDKVSEEFSKKMRLRAISDLHEPGSTFKLITAACALQEGYFSTDDMFDGNLGAITVNGVTIHDDHPIGKANFAEAFEQSSNIIFSKIAAQTPDNVFYKYMRDFGFGMKLGIDLKGEQTGLIRKPGSFNELTKRYMGFGHSISATALQICNAYAAVANGGLLMRPYLVWKTLDYKGDLVELRQPRAIRRVVSKDIADTLKKLLVRVVEDGTGKNARIKNMKIAGKTGTSQQFVGGAYSREDYTASFVGFFPAENPKVALIVLLDRPQKSIYGGTAAAPIFRKIALRWTSTAPEYWSDENNETDSSETVIVPSIIGFYGDRAAEVARSNNLNLANYQKDKPVKTQKPKPGASVKPGSAIEAGYLDDGDGKIPNVRGLTTRRAANLLQNAGIKVKIDGSGVVRSQRIMRFGKDKERYCLLICR